MPRTKARTRHERQGSCRIANRISLLREGIFSFRFHVITYLIYMSNSHRCSGVDKETDAKPYSLSFVGNVFFSCVSVFFSLVLSNVVTSEISGLSAMARGWVGKPRDRGEKANKAIFTMYQGSTICRASATPSPPPSRPDR